MGIPRRTGLGMPSDSGVSEPRFRLHSRSAWKGWPAQPPGDPRRPRPRRGARLRLYVRLSSLRYTLFCFFVFDSLTLRCVGVDLSLSYLELIFLIVQINVFHRIWDLLAMISLSIVSVLYFSSPLLLGLSTCLCWYI